MSQKVYPAAIMSSLVENLEDTVVFLNSEIISVNPKYKKTPEIGRWYKYTIEIAKDEQKDKTPIAKPRIKTMKFEMSLLYENLLP